MLQTLSLPTEVVTQLLEGIRSAEAVNGLTHDFYRYPARFSPSFARAVIRAFTDPGDLVLDPFMGGGTTLVEAVALGRQAIGCDISTLASFIAEAKTISYTHRDLDAVQDWAYGLGSLLNLRQPAKRPEAWIEAGYQRNINSRQLWPVRKTIELILANVDALRSKTERTLARCAVLKTGQWAMDCQDGVPSASEFRRKFIANIDAMCEAARTFGDSVRSSSNSEPVRATCLNCPAAALPRKWKRMRLASPRLILTSPPYPGVHVLYHRWQVAGRKETPAPFWIADSLDGGGGSYYTFGDRRVTNTRKYYSLLFDSFSALARLSNDDTLIVSMVSFAKPSDQLPLYLKVMADAGLSEVFLSAVNERIDRRVPHRKWYAKLKGEIHSSREVVLFHRRSPGSIRVSGEIADQRRLNVQVP